MRDIAIRVEGLSKQYRIGKRERYRTLRDTLTDAVTAPMRRLRSALRGANAEQEENSGDLIWALKDVSFEIPHGAVVGVIGRNGAGKSTLLKILSRITEPTEGYAEVRGRVGSLLEVGTGFHPELTGRENIYLNGAILGIKKADIERKFDEIVAFAEVETFIDTPVKHYSSGMYTRLAFAVAAHLEPEILVIDEVLAVGDAAFQKKCLGKIGEVARSGRTAVFVSHNLTAVANLCRTAILIDRGRLVCSGNASRVIGQYLQPDAALTTFDRASFPNDADFQLLSASITQDGSPPGLFSTSAPVNINLEYVVKRRIVGLRLGIDITTLEGQTLWRSYDDDLARTSEKSWSAGRYVTVAQLPANLFFPRQYLVSLSIGIQRTRWITFEKVQQIIQFYNLNGVGSAYADDQDRPGLLMVGLNWTTAALSEDGGSPALALLTAESKGDEF
jgi:lipopolysaccharide transport system ATP-binding protein